MISLPFGGTFIEVSDGNPTTPRLLRFPYRLVGLSIRQINISLKITAGQLVLYLEV